MGGIKCMSSILWKSILLKHKEVCNHFVHSIKRTNPQFPEEDLNHQLAPFFDSILTKQKVSFDEETIVSLFETLVILISKHVILPLDQSTSKFFQIVSEIQPEAKKDPILFLSLFTNVFSKVETNQKQVFLNRLHSVVPKIQTIEEVKLVLGLLYWASGKPEYRQSLKTNFHHLNQSLKSEIQNLFGIDESSMDFPFLPLNRNQISKPNFHFRTIPGYTLFGGNFLGIPVLYLDFENILVLSGESWFQIFVDEYGTSLYPIEKPQSPTKVSSKPSTFWKQILEQKIDTSHVVSTFEMDSYTIVTLKNSYQLYLFYVGRT